VDGSLLREWFSQVDLEADSAAVLFSAPLHELLDGHKPDSVLLSLRLLADGKTLDSKEHYFVPAKEISLSRPVITVAETTASGGLSFTVTSDVARGSILLKGGIFSDNFFDLLQGSPRL
jgi:beta-mannosidase